MFCSRNRALSLVAALTVLPGCGGGKTNEAAKPAEPGATPAAVQRNDQATPAGASVAATSPAYGKWEVRTDAEGRKWFGDVPYDVFFDDPLGVANDNSAVTMVAEPDKGSETPAPTEPEMSEEPTEAATPSGSGWAIAITAEELTTEVKTIRNFLNPKLQSTGAYNSNLAMIPHHAATLAVLAGIAAEHEGDITWKADALYIRDLAGLMNEEPMQRGAKFQRKLLGQFEQISDTLNRSRPADLPDPDPESTLADHAEIGLLMKRLDEAYNELKTNAGSEASFKKSPDKVRRQASIIAAICEAITKPGYGYEDDEEFVAFAKTVVKESRNMVDSIELEEFESYDKSLSTAYQACNNCHLGYK